MEELTLSIAGISARACLCSQAASCPGLCLGVDEPGWERCRGPSDLGWERCRGPPDSGWERCRGPADPGWEKYLWTPLTHGGCVRLPWCSGLSYFLGKLHCPR